MQYVLRVPITELRTLVEQKSKQRVQNNKPEYMSLVWILFCQSWLQYYSWLASLAVIIANSKGAEPRLITSKEFEQLHFLQSQRQRHVQTICCKRYETLILKQLLRTDLIFKIKEQSISKPPCTTLLDISGCLNSKISDVNIEIILKSTQN